VIGSVHVELPDDMTAREIHHLTRQISAGVYDKFGIVLTVGIYASNTESEESAAIRESLMKIAGDYPEFRQLHGFYVEPKGKRVSFDAVLEFGSDAGQIRKEILEKIGGQYPDYTFDMVLDSDFSE
jgi:hypothetical protein